MVSPTLVSGQQTIYQVPFGKLRLLIISDSAERLVNLNAVLNIGEVEITSAAPPEKMCLGCRGGHDLVVVDVSPEVICGVLKVLIGCPAGRSRAETARNTLIFGEELQ